MKTLVVCYSRKGTTAKVADAVAVGLGAVTERIIDKKDRGGLFGYLGAGRDATRERPADIEEPRNDPAAFELVVVGTPIWNARMSTPILSYLKRYAGKFQKVAFFISCGGRYKDTLDKMAIAAGKQPVATLVILKREVVRNEHLPKVRDFVGKLQA
jgi:menaquinone-dependent protoporphyrinogen IX oxidase